jgi:hypothetical protein
MMGISGGPFQHEKSRKVIRSHKTPPTTTKNTLTTKERESESLLNTLHYLQYLLLLPFRSFQGKRTMFAVFEGSNWL